MFTRTLKSFHFANKTANAADVMGDFDEKMSILKRVAVTPTSDWRGLLRLQILS